ncbi:MAG: OmpA family protein [Hyphomonadaceae bacterium]|nr:OmpA family protein [Hyphomonadaceae bacterium]
MTTVLVIAAFALAACGDSANESSASSQAPVDVEASLESVSVDPEGEPIDFLTYGAGAFPVRFDRATQGTAAAAVLDGRLGYASISRSPTGPEQPIVLTVELPAETTFAVFGIPAQSSFGCCSNAHIGTVTVEGSNRSPDEGYVRLASFHVDPGIYDEKQLFPADAQLPVRWVRVTLEGRQVPDPDDYRGTAFTELFGYGTQAAIPLDEDQFTGRWLTGGGGGGENGNRIELIQEGALVTGCGTSGGSSFTVSGGIENGLLRYVVGADTVPIVAVINSENQLSGAMIGRSFGRVIGEPGGAPTSCTPGASPPPNPVATALNECRAAIVYGVNFDVDSDVIRRDAEPALNQILRALSDRPDMAVVIEGHTDSDGSDQYNIDLSGRRAAAVVSWLVAHGANSEKLTASGRGEAEPIADNETSAGKASNRRVEVQPSC